MRQALLTAALCLAGCATDSVDRVGTEPRAAITHAALARYPGDPQTSDRIEATAVVNPDQDEITIYNLASRPIPPGTLWINGSFLHRLPNGIAPKGHITVKTSELLEAGGGARDLQRTDHPIERVEIETPEGLFVVRGPAVHDK